MDASTDVPRKHALMLESEGETRIAAYGISLALAVILHDTEGISVAIQAIEANIFTGKIDLDSAKAMRQKAMALIVSVMHSKGGA